MKFCSHLNITSFIIEHLYKLSFKISILSLASKCLWSFCFLSFRENQSIFHWINERNIFHDKTLLLNTLKTNCFNCVSPFIIHASNISRHSHSAGMLYVGICCTYIYIYKLSIKNTVRSRLIRWLTHNVYVS